MYKELRKLETTIQNEIQIAHENLEKLSILRKKIFDELRQTNEEFYEVLDEILLLGLPDSITLLSGLEPGCRFLTNIKTKNSGSEFYYGRHNELKITGYSYYKVTRFELTTKSRKDYLITRKIIVDYCKNKNYYYLEDCVYSQKYSINIFLDRTYEEKKPENVCLSLDSRAEFTHLPNIPGVTSYTWHYTKFGIRITVFSFKKIDIIRKYFNDCFVSHTKIRRNEYEVDVLFPANLINLDILYEDL